MVQLIRTPKVVDVDITTECNLRCRYCYHFSGPGDVNHDLPLTNWLSFFEELEQAAVMEVSLCGGEPFIREDILDILDGIVKNRMRFSLLSNGSLITEEHAAAIAKTGRCSYIQVSLDGASPGTHDIIRGDGSFEGAVRGIQILRRYGITVTSRVTIHPQNIDELEEISRLLLEEIGLRSFSTNYVSPIGLAQENEPRLQMTTDELNQAMETLVRLNQKYHGRIGASAGPLADARLFHEMEEARRLGLPSYQGKGHLVACNCPWNKLAVRADGVIIPCILLSHIELGRINQDSIVEIWQHHPELHRFRSRKDIALSSFEFCRGCEWMPYCTGNCPGSGYSLNGDVYHPSPQGCLKQFIEAGGKIPVFSRS